MSQATLETERLCLRPRERADLEDCFRMNMEPGMLDHIDFPRDGDWADEAAHRAYLEETFAYRHPNGLGYWTVTRKDDPAFLGWVLMAPEDLSGPDVEIGWRFRTAAQGRGYATEAASALVRHGFEDLALERLVAEIHEGNAASIGVARKLGMRERHHPAPIAEAHPVWELTREMWAEQT